MVGQQDGFLYNGHYCPVHTPLSLIVLSHASLIYKCQQLHVFACGLSLAARTHLDCAQPEVPGECTVPKGAFNEWQADRSIDTTALSPLRISHPEIHVLPASWGSTAASSSFHLNGCWLHIHPLLALSLSNFPHPLPTRGGVMGSPSKLISCTGILILGSAPRGYPVRQSLRLHQLS